MTMEHSTCTVMHRCITAKAVPTSHDAKSHRGDMAHHKCAMQRHALLGWEGSAAAHHSSDCTMFNEPRAASYWLPCTGQLHSRSLKTPCRYHWSGTGPSKLTTTQLDMQSPGTNATQGMRADTAWLSLAVRHSVTDGQMHTGSNEGVNGATSEALNARHPAANF